MDFKKLFRKDEKAVSPVIGVILMVAITVILAAAIGSSVFSKGTAESAPQANFNIKAGSAGSDTAAATINIEHLGGDPVHFEKDTVTKVMASVNGDTAVQIASANTTSSILGTLDVGSIKKLELNIKGGSELKAGTTEAPKNIGAGDTVNIKFIDVQTNQIICDKDVRF